MAKGGMFLKMSSLIKILKMLKILSIFSLLFLIVSWIWIFNLPKINSDHPEIKDQTDVYIVVLNDNVSDICFDRRFKKVVPVSEGIVFLSQCPLDSNRYHLNVKNK